MAYVFEVMYPALQQATTKTKTPHGKGEESIEQVLFDHERGGSSGEGNGVNRICENGGENFESAGASNGGGNDDGGDRYRQLGVADSPA